MNKKWLSFLVPITIFAVFVYTNMAKQSEAIKSYNKITPPNQSVFEKLINSHRTSIGRPSLIHDDSLCAFAKQRATKLFAVDWKNLGHFEFEKDVDASGLYGRPLQENISEGPNEQAMLDGLLTSQSHKETLESEKNQYTCVAVKGQMVVQIFAEK